MSTARKEVLERLQALDAERDELQALAGMVTEFERKIAEKRIPNPEKQAEIAERQVQGVLNRYAVRDPFNPEPDKACGTCGGAGEVQVAWSAQRRLAQACLGRHQGLSMETCKVCKGSGER